MKIIALHGIGDGQPRPTEVEAGEEGAKVVASGVGVTVLDLWDGEHTIVITICQMWKGGTDVMVISSPMMVAIEYVRSTMEKEEDVLRFVNTAIEGFLMKQRKEAAVS